MSQQPKELNEYITYSNLYTEAKIYERLKFLMVESSLSADLERWLHCVNSIWITFRHRISQTDETQRIDHIIKRCRELLSPSARHLRGASKVRSAIEYEQNKVYAAEVLEYLHSYMSELGEKTGLTGKRLEDDLDNGEVYEVTDAALSDAVRQQAKRTTNKKD